MKLLGKQESKPEKILVPLMEKFQAADKAMRIFQSKNERIFTSYQTLVEARDVAENELRTAAKNLGAGYETETVVCEYVMPKHHYYDPNVLRESVSSRILNSLGVIQTKEVVDEKLLKMLVRAKKIKKSIMESAYRQEPTGSPRVTISIKEEIE